MTQTAGPKHNRKPKEKRKAAVPDDVQTGEVSGSQAPSSGPAIRVVYIGGEQNKAAGVRRVLEETPGLSFELAHARHLRDEGREEIALLLSQCNFDAILLDLDDPEMDALETLRTLQLAVPSVPILVTASAMQEAQAVEAVRSGAQDYLIKEHLDAYVLQHAITLALERKRANEGLSRLAAIVESSDDYIIGKTLEGIIVSWNSGAARIYGYSAAEAVGQPVSLIMPPERKEDFEGILDRIREGKRVEHYETLRVTKDGRLIDVAVTVSPVKDASGRITGASAVGRDITEQKRLREDVRRRTEELQANYQRLATLVANVDIALMMFDRNARIVLVNDCWVKRNAVPRDAVLGKRYEEMGSDPTLQHAQQVVDDVLATGQPHVFHELHYANRAQPDESGGVGLPLGTGDTFIDGSVQAIRDVKGEITGAMAVSIDVTEKVLAQREAEAKGALFASVIAESPIGIVVYDREMRVAEMNAEYAHVARFDPDSVIGKVLYDIAPTTSSRRLQHERALAGEDIDDVDVPFKFPDEPRERRADVRYRPLRDNEGNIFGILGTVVDVTERFHAQADLQAQKALLQAFIQATPVGLVYCDRDMRLVEMNAAFAAIEQIDPAKATGQSLYTLVPWLESPDARAVQERVLAGERVEVQHLVREGPAGPTGKERHFFDVYYQPVKESNNQIGGIVCAVLDVTERFELDRRKDEFLSLASHELKTPVTVIKGFSHLALNSAVRSGDERQIRALRAIDDQSGHLTRLINDLLDVSKIENDALPLYKEEFDLSALVDEIARNAELTNNGLTVRVDLPPEPLLVTADRHLIHQVITNLVDNAAKYSLPDPAGERRVEIGAVRSEHQVTISVRDFGVGIPPEEQALIFERFYRATTATSQPHNGLGLGLFISRGIVERHGGRMWLESAEGEGSTFYFSLDLSNEE